MKALILIIFTINADEILKKLREDRKIESSRFYAKIEIVKGKRTLFKEFEGYSKGSDFYIVFKNPEDKDVKYLKIKNDLFIYIPDIDDIVRISGDMLKQSFMGTDLSYEDLMQEDPLRYYKPLNIKDTVINSDTLYLMEIVDTTKKAPYFSINLFIDKKNILIKKEELFTKNRRKIKEVQILDYKKIGEKFYPLIYIMRDLRLKNSYTKVVFKEIEIGIKVKDDIFKLEYLRK
ncbi:MAG: outer membrane lipoprotein-sorting protein [Candidatus Hydrothermales bacterium]